MMIKKKNKDRLLRNKQKVIWINAIIFVIVFIAVTLIHRGKSHSIIYQKLQGACGIIPEKSYITRKNYFRPLGGQIIEFKGNTIVMPIMLTKEEDEEPGSYENIVKYKTNSTGKWEIINTSPDSILIETPKSILNGKYAVKFAWLNDYHIMRYYIIFSNDSTMLVCEKPFAMATPILKEWGEEIPLESRDSIDYFWRIGDD